MIPDPLRRIRVPRDLAKVTTIGTETDPTEVGLDDANIERIWKSVEALYKSGIHPAIALCVRRGGEVIIDRAIGHASGNGPGEGHGINGEDKRVLATPDTPFCIFSASKAITATVVHKLDEKGLIHIGDPVAHYLPEFARHGKGNITIGHVLAHRAGVPSVPREAFDLDRAQDIDFLRELMYDAKPQWRAGKKQGYHAISGGNLLAEVVREVTGKDIQQVLAEEIRDPLGMHWLTYGASREDQPNIALNYPTGPPLLPPASTLITRALGLPPDEATRISNDPRFYDAVLPAANCVSTANELSRFYEMLLRGGELDGVRVLEERTIRRALIEQSHLEVDLSLGLPIGFSYGFMLGGKLLSLYGPDTVGAFGHLGWINIIGWADPRRDLSAALITTGKCVLYPEVVRFWDIARRIGKECAPIVA